ncbi:MULTISPECIES: bifunctional GNAT family N-acetyltransferase/carbon-nitrogen hydrolase family protein [Pseudomonadota]|uniref:Putative amidohydrolase n=1 Tax=Gallaecimonas pentaromativorans TaxID=584787 RepID=A0A3N1PLZ9_9GAMM|nr:bifunctional GNAT family N-acetyltransferase/carbon-nitrogen hydrolase family protein [Gallaecimonas pentaromativorans]MED5525962.1 bifunctional GNAT family N-acetyltransferase/carbon-nitrogen hydrolase family protein [Pseudomonadota bacterium]ROQ29725.1 putative amidohydrolase [Gallaecimonas pentaromativorans]
MSTEDLILKVRELTKDDFPQLKQLMDTVYKDIGGSWPKHTIDTLIGQFPEGQICIEDQGQLVAVALTVQVDYKRFSNPHTYDDLITNRMTIAHDDNGDALYGLDVFIDPEYRGYRLGRRLYEARKELCRSLNLRAILAGGRIVNYCHHADELTPSQYIEEVDRKAIYDPILSFQLANDFQVKRLLRQYLPEDKKSQGYATLLEWSNILFDPEESTFSQKRQVRIGAVQWQMREFHSAEEVLKQVEYFVDAVSDYKSDFVVFPEFFNAPLMGLANTAQQQEAIRYLASFTEHFRQQLSQMAVSYNINIITGSMPLLEGKELFNVAYLCRRDGSTEVQYKLHITPHERRDWVIEGGHKVQAFDTDAGKVGILVCYDVEFPELGRILADQGMEMLFVPFWTDTKNAYLRVRHCAQARAIENECYVAICGSVGNLPQVESLDVQYAQSAVFSPSDFAFPHDAVMAEATPNTEMILFSDLDLDKLKVVRSEGSVRNLKDRRRDLFTLTLHK